VEVAFDYCDASTMPPPRFKMSGLMIAVAVLAVLFALSRLNWCLGLAAALQVAITTLVASRGSSRSSYWLALGLGIVGTLLVPFCVATAINRDMWGYSLSRPPVDRRIAEARLVETITPVFMWNLGTFVSKPFDKGSDYTEAIPMDEDFYWPDKRVLRLLKIRGVLPEEPRQMADERLASLYQTLERTGKLEEPPSKNPEDQKLGGIVVEASDRRGQPLLFVGVWGIQADREHIPYYEFLFTNDSPEKAPTLLGFQRFYLAIGSERLDWSSFIPALVLFGAIPTVPIQGIVLWWGRKTNRRSAATAS
jgi:hypothetical protein